MKTGPLALIKAVYFFISRKIFFFSDRMRSIPCFQSIAKKVHVVFLKESQFPGSEAYWVRRYRSGGNSGSGSYNHLAEFKAEIINYFLKDNNVTTVIEYGCGDGNQLKLAEYPTYVGFDVSPEVIALCQDVFRNDKTKKFRLISQYRGETAQLTLSLDVIYHLIEDDNYIAYMERLFESSERFVIIYSSNYEEQQKYHERRRRFTKWIETNKSDWKLIDYIPNRFPYNSNNGEGSLSDFYIYEKT